MRRYLGGAHFRAADGLTVLDPGFLLMAASTENNSRDVARALQSEEEA